MISSGARLTLEYIRSLRISKFDLLFRTIFTAANSSLPRMMKIPDGDHLPLGFPGLDSRYVDGLFATEDSIYHIEFQTRVHPTMEWRMLEYYLKISLHHMSTKHANKRINQRVVYLGVPETPLPNGISRDGINFEFQVDDIQKLGKDWEDLLGRSTHPLDWILLVLCMEDAQREAWIDLAISVNEFCLREPHDSADLKAFVLIAALLRVDSETLQREIETVLNVNIQASPLLREAYEFERKKAQLESRLEVLGNLIVAANCRLSKDQRRTLNKLTIGEIDEFMAGFFNASDRQEYLQNLDGPRPEIAPRPFG